MLKLTDEDIDQLEGVELKRTLVEKVLKLVPSGSTTGDGLPIYNLSMGNTLWLRDWQPETKISDAWQIMKAMTAMDDLDVTLVAKGYLTAWTCSALRAIGDGSWEVEASAPTAQLAIMRCALKVSRMYK